MVADRYRVHMLDFMHCLYGAPQGRRIRRGKDQLFMDHGREHAVDVSPIGSDGVMSKRFSNDDADGVVLAVDTHCPGFL
jgi:hypothetical protein